MERLTQPSSPHLKLPTPHNHKVSLPASPLKDLYNTLLSLPLLDTLLSFSLFSLASTASPYGQPPPAYNQPPPGYVGYPPQPPQAFPQQPQAPLGVFDQGARFAPGQAVHIPPPPPGVAPTAAQAAAQQGQSVVMTQAPRDVLGGGSDAGYTIF